MGRQSGVSEILVWPAVDYLRRIHGHSIELRKQLHHRNPRSAEDQQMLDALNEADLWPNSALLGNLLLTIGIALLLIAAFPP